MNREELVTQTVNHYKDFYIGQIRQAAFSGETYIITTNENYKDIQNHDENAPEFSKLVIKLLFEQLRELGYTVEHYDASYVIRDHFKISW